MATVDVNGQIYRVLDLQYCFIAHITHYFYLSFKTNDYEYTYGPMLPMSVNLPKIGDYGVGVFLNRIRCYGYHINYLKVNINIYILAQHHDKDICAVWTGYDHYWEHYMCFNFRTF